MRSPAQGEARPAATTRGTRRPRTTAARTRDKAKPAAAPRKAEAGALAAAWRPSRSGGGSQREPLHPGRHRARLGRVRARPAGAAAGQQPAQPDLGGDEVAEPVQRQRLARGGGRSALRTTRASMRPASASSGAWKRSSSGSSEARSRPEGRPPGTWDGAPHPGGRSSYAGADAGPRAGRGPGAGAAPAAPRAGRGRPGRPGCRGRERAAAGTDGGGLLEDAVGPPRGGPARPARGGRPAVERAAAAAPPSWRRTDTSASASPVSQRAAGPGRTQAMRGQRGAERPAGAPGARTARAQQPVGDVLDSRAGRACGRAAALPGTREGR